MNNNNRYDKLNAVIHLQNQKVHYRGILEAKKNIDFHKKHSVSFNLKSYSRPNKDIDRLRRQNNQKLIKKILEIQSSKGLFQNMEAKGKEYKSKVKGNQKKEMDRKGVQRENLRMASRLSGVKATIMTKNQWKNHYKYSRNLQKNLRKHSYSKIYDPESCLPQTLKQLTHTDKNTLDRLSFCDITSQPRSQKKLSRRRLKNKSQHSHNVDVLTEQGEEHKNIEQFKLDINTIILNDEKHQ